jgi:hypothetical protein
MKPIFEATDDGLEIIDRIERHRYHLTTHTPTPIEPVDGNRVQYPVDAAVEITTDTITLPTNNHIYIRENNGSLITEVKPGEQTYLPESQYTIDISGPLKLYIQVKSSVHVYSDPENTHINFNNISRVIIGARSYHTRPATAITTTSDPIDVMKTVSLFGSALKSTTAERSYPTLRGHPPAVELGESLEIPSGISHPDTGVKIEVPPKLEYIYAVAPLSYYLGAKLVPGRNPKIKTKSRYEYEFKQECDVEAGIKRVLKQVFFLDCVVRENGITPISICKSDAIESAAGFDIESIYQMPLYKQIENYLQVPYPNLEPYLPEWRLETKVKPVDDTVEFLPYVTNSLSLISVSGGETDSRVSAPDEMQIVSEFTRGAFMQSTKSTRSQGPSAESKIDSKLTTVRQTWNERGIPKIASTTPLTAFRNSTEREPREDPIEIEVVCNDSEMQEEFNAVDRIYGDREELPFDVTLHRSITIEEFEEVLSKGCDFLHYIGHIDQNGFQCTDGRLDASTVDETKIKAFLLNACQSHDQGLHLIDSGGIGGIVTLGDVVNSGAVKIGNTIAQLLNQGFPLYGALDIARNESVFGQQYIIVGDGMTAIAQAETNVPNVCISKKQDGEYLVRLRTYDSTRARRGSVFTPHIDATDEYYLVPGTTDELSVTKDSFQEFLTQGRFPILVDGTVRWSNEFSAEHR